MQKKVLAAVVGGMLIAPAAFAEVTISGRISVGVENYEVDAPGSDSELRVSDQSSSLIFSGSEDLGGGLKAWFQIDNRVSFDGSNATSIGATGNTQVGLQGDWGKLALGRSDLHYNELFRYDASRSGSLQSWVTGSVFSQVGGAPVANTTRWTNVIVYDGNFGGGLSARVAFSPAGSNPTFGLNLNEGDGTVPNGSDGDAMNAVLRWSSGPLSLGASIFTADPEGGGTVGEHDSQRAWVGYQFGGLSVAFGYDNSEITGIGERTAFAVPVKFTTGSETFYLRYAMADDLETTAGDVPNSGANIMSVGWDHALSKRTVVGVHYTTLDNDDAAGYDMFAIGASGLTSTAVGEDASQLYFGVAHFY